MILIRARILLAQILLGALIALVGCGGIGNGSGGGTTTPPPPPPTITSVAVSCSVSSTSVGQANQCSAKVLGTGNFNSAVSWSVSGIQGGNLTLGTVSSSGLYTAPTAVPSPYTVNVTATSSQDGTKSAFVSVIVAGTITTVSQPINANKGGSITLSDGSSVGIPSNFLTANQNVTVSESSSPLQPPNPLLVGVGQTLTLTFSNPIQPSTVSKHRREVPASDQTSTGLTFTVSESTISGLEGSEGLVALTDTAGNTVFEPATYSSSSGSAQLFVPISAVTGLQNPVSTVAVTPVNTVYQAYPTNLPPSVVLPSTLCWQASTSRWVDFTANCANQVSGQKVLLVVHGMMSCVEQLETLVSYEPIVSQYDLILGFDYDWTQHLIDSGSLLATFLQQLASASKIDIIAHSEGVPVSLYAASQATNRASIKNFVGLAGPVIGTPFGNDLTAETAVFLDYRGSTSAGVCPASQTLQNYSFETMLQRPFIGDLEKNSSVLTQTILPSVQDNIPSVTITLAGGTNQCPLCYIYEFGSPFGSTPNDGIVGLDSALGFDSGLPVHPLPPFPLFHTDLPGDTSTGGVLDDVASQLNASQTMTLPTISCTSSKDNCEGAAQSLFTFTGSGFSSNASNIQIFSQDSTGIVTASEPTIDDDGVINWTEVGPSVAARFSIFSFDNTALLASNNIMQIIDSASADIAFEPTSLSFGSVQTGSSATQSIAVSNTGTTALQITQISLTNNQGGFSENSQDCPASLSPGATCTISVIFTPTQAGVQSASVSVTDNAPDSPQSVPLSGTGTSSVQAPNVTTGSASSVTTNSATLGGTVNPNGSDTQVWFQYSTNSTMSGASQTPQQDIGAGTTTIPFNANLYPLNPNTAYYYQAMGSNAAGNGQGSVLSFTTSSQQPVLTTFTISPGTVTSGQSATVTLGLSSATSQTATISLSPISSAFPVPSTVNIQAGQSTTSFSATSGMVSAPTTVTITAAYNGASLQSQITVDPPTRVVTSIAPNPVAASSADQPIGIFGSNFQSGDTLTFVDTAQVAHQSVASKLNFVSSSQIDYEFNNNNDLGTWTVTVNSADGTQHSNTFSFLVAEFTIGENVMVSGTGGAGLNLRTSASTSCSALVDMPDGTVMGVIGGPSTGDGYTWWYLTGSVNGTNYTGWAIQNYLIPD